MKNIFFVLAIMFASTVNAQSTSPRFGTTPNNDNTFRTLTNSYKAVTDAAGADTATLNLAAFNNIVKITAVDSLQLKSPVVTRSAFGDKLTILVTAASGTPKVKFATGGNWISAGTATLSTGLRAVITFIFDGAKWVESARVVQ